MSVDIGIKDGVRFKVITRQMRSVMNAVEMVFMLKILPNPVITSANDGTHLPKSGRESLHYSNQALDWRLKHLPVSMRKIVCDDVAKILGPDYDVVHEDPGGDNEHMHVEFDPKPVTM